MSRQRVWFARDCYLSGDPKMVELGLEFGPGGPFAVEELMALAKLADDRGHVTTSWVQLERRAFLASPEQAKEIVYAADALRALTIRRVDPDHGRVTVHFARWSDWQFDGPKDKGAADRQRRYRERQREKGNVTSEPSRADKRAVLERDKVCQRCGTDEDLVVDHIVPRSQGGDNDRANLQALCYDCNAAKQREDQRNADRNGDGDGDGPGDGGDGPTETETGTEPHSPDPSPEGEGDLPPARPKGNRERALRAHDRAVAAWAPHPETVPEAWEDCRSALRAMVEPVQWRIYLEALHPHRVLIGGGWALGAPPEYAKWVMDRFGALLAEACSGPVFVVPCATCPTTSSDLANPKEESR